MRTSSLTIGAHTKVDLLREAVFLVCFSDTEDCVRRSFGDVRPNSDSTDRGGPRCERTLSGRLPDGRTQCRKHNGLSKAKRRVAEIVQRSRDPSQVPFIQVGVKILEMSVSKLSEIFGLQFSPAARPACSS